MDNILALHIETTGFNSYNDEIIAIALCSCDKNFNINRTALLYRKGVDEKKLKQSYKFNKLSINFLNENGLEEEEFVEELVSFIIHNFDLNETIHLLGYNLVTFGHPFLTSLFNKHGINLDISPNTLDAYTLASTLLSDQLIGNVTIKNLVDVFCKEDCVKEEQVMKKCITFVNIFKQVKKVWNKKVLKNK